MCHDTYSLLNLNGLHSFTCETWGWSSLLYSPNFWGAGWSWGPKEKATKTVLGCRTVSRITFLGMSLEALWQVKCSQRDPQGERENGGRDQGPEALHSTVCNWVSGSEAQLRLLLIVRLGVPHLWQAPGLQQEWCQAEMSSETSWLHDSDTRGPRVQEEVRHVWLRES